MAPHVFCTDVCSERGEPLAGTGMLTNRILLLRWPRAKWRVPRHKSDGMSPELGLTIRTAMKSGVHVALVDQPNTSGPIPLLQSPLDGKIVVEADETALIDAIRAYGQGGTIGGDFGGKPAILCCTDSKRDACCAKFGFATFKSLAKQVDPAQFQLFQSTHLGGCRFAASIVVLPQRQRYGRLAPDDVAPFLAALADGQPYWPRYRGDSDLSEFAQVAQIAAHDAALKMGLRGPVTLAPDNSVQTPLPGDMVAVEAQTAHHRFTVELTAVPFDVQGRCDDVAAGESERLLRWVAREASSQNAGLP